ncbi:hypothetical protein D3C72_1315760 [compost metagenome]
MAETTAQAFSSALRVTTSRGSGPSPITAFMSCFAARRISGARSLNTAGTMLEPMGARPSASDTMPMVLAVNCPAQAPAVGRQARLMASSSSCVAVPASTLPMVS